MVIKRLLKKDLSKLVELHYETLPTEFLTSISKDFLYCLYNELFNSSHTVFYGAFEKKLNLCGVIVGIGKEYKPGTSLYINCFKTLIQNYKIFVKHPKKIYFLLQTLLFKVKNSPKTEILFIGVRQKYQRRGIGNKLVYKLDKFMISNKYKSLYVDCKTKLTSNYFYVRIGFKYVSSFDLYGERWNRYEKKY